MTELLEAAQIAQVVLDVSRQAKGTTSDVFLPRGWDQATATN
jgi:hypothetical protein